MKWNIDSRQIPLSAPKSDFQIKIQNRSIGEHVTFNPIDQMGSATEVQIQCGPGRNCSERRNAPIEFILFTCPLFSTPRNKMCCNDTTDSGLISCIRNLVLRPEVYLFCNVIVVMLLDYLSS